MLGRERIMQVMTKFNLFILEVPSAAANLLSGIHL